MDNKEKGNLIGKGFKGEITMIREITENDFDGLMTLYMQLHDNPFPEKSMDIDSKEEY